MEERGHVTGIGANVSKVLYYRQCQYTQANEYHFDGANSIETTNH